MSFGSFDYFCNQVSLTVCPLVGGIEPKCYSRNIELITDQLVFQPATMIIYFIAIIMNIIMIYHIRSKYTAVGRKEMLIFFYMYMVLIILELFLTTGWIPVAWSNYKYFVGLHMGWKSGMIWCLLLNGFVGFQWSEDGTSKSVWSIRLSSLAVVAAVFGISIATFDNMGLSSSSPFILFVIYFIVNPVMLFIYVVMQIILVIHTLDDRWPLGDILFGVVFYITGQIFELIISTQICNVAKHYIDGLFFGTVFTLLSVMMVYKYWDSITKEDLEFSVGGKVNVWELKDDMDTK